MPNTAALVAFFQHCQAASLRGRITPSHPAGRARFFGHNGRSLRVDQRASWPAVQAAESLAKACGGRPGEEFEAVVRTDGGSADITITLLRMGGGTTSVPVPLQDHTRSANAHA